MLKTLPEPPKGNQKLWESKFEILPIHYKCTANINMWSWRYSLNVLKHGNHVVGSQILYHLVVNISKQLADKD